MDKHHKALYSKHRTTHKVNAGHNKLKHLPNDTPSLKHIKTKYTYSGVKKECDLVAQNAKKSLISLVHKTSLLKFHWFNDPRSLAKLSICKILSSFGAYFYMKMIQKKISTIFLNPMIVFVCGNHQENENGSTFSFSKIRNTCIKIGISDLHLVKLPPIYVF